MIIAVLCRMNIALAMANPQLKPAGDHRRF